MGSEWSLELARCWQKDAFVAVVFVRVVVFAVSVWTHGSSSFVAYPICLLFFSCCWHQLWCRAVVVKRSLVRGWWLWECSVVFGVWRCLRGGVDVLGGWSMRVCTCLCLSRICVAVVADRGNGQ